MKRFSSPSGVITLLLLSSQVDAAQKWIKGPEKQIDLPLQKEVGEDPSVPNSGRPERMTMTYWTTLVEPKACVKSPFECQLNEYETYLEGDLELKNVNVLELPDVFIPADPEAGTVGAPEMEFRLAFNQIGKANANVFDIYKFTYPWTKSRIALKEGWTCDDGFSIEPDDTSSPQIDLQTSTGKDSFLRDRAQDCIVDQDLSSVTVDDNNFATFKVHFLRSLKTRGILNDSILEIGEPVQIQYYYKQTPGGGVDPITDKMKTDALINLEVDEVTEQDVLKLEQLRVEEAKEKDEKELELKKKEGNVKNLEGLEDGYDENGFALNANGLMVGTFGTLLTTLLMIQ